MNDPDILYQKIREKVSSYLPLSDLEVLDRAYALSKSSHADQTRESGELFIFHPLAVTDFLADMKMDAATLSATLLHDVPEDCNLPIEVIEKEFGKEIASLVDGVTKLGQIKTKVGLPEDIQAILGQADTFHKMMSAAANDVRVLLIKLADRLHNMQTILALPMNRRRKVVSSTVRIYIPLAARLGIWSIKTQMEDLALQAIDPDSYLELTQILNDRLEEHRREFENITRLLTHRFKDWGIEAEAKEIPPTIFELHTFSMQTGLAFNQAPDTIVILVLVPQRQDCYTSLGVIHSLWKPVPGKVVDYIVSPRENLYRSLHTTVIGPGGKVLKFRIRTYEMNESADLGMYNYLQKIDSSSTSVKPEDRVWGLGKIVEWGTDIGDLTGESASSNFTQEFVESLMSDFLPEHIDVFTPKGDVYELPLGSTPLDLAYAIHTDLGHSARSARINNQNQRLNRLLHNGDQVLILTLPAPDPEFEWLDPYLGYVKTSVAKRAIRRWFRRQSKQQQMELGRSMLTREFSLLGYENFDFSKLLPVFGHQDEESLFIAVGSAELMISEVAKLFLDKELGFEPNPASNITGSFIIQGAGNLKTRMGKCCNPSPGTHIVGRINENNVITVHQVDCKYALKAIDQGKLIALSWCEKSQATRPVQFYVEALDRPKLLLDFTSITGEADVNMEQVQATTEQSKNRAAIRATLLIQNSDQLLKILHQVAHITNVRKVHVQLNIPSVY
jgi:GTP pyrophosphokinase